MLDEFIGLMFRNRDVRFVIGDSDRRARHWRKTKYSSMSKAPPKT